MSTHSHDHKHHAHDIDFKKVFTVTKEAGSQVKIVGEIPFAELVNERKAAIKTLGGNVELDGFRKGNVPENILVKHVGEMAILNEMAERAIAHMYPHILEAHDIDPIGHPKVEITKLAPENPLGVSIIVATMPAVTLPDYKKLAAGINKDKESKEVTEAEVEKQIGEILRQKMAYDRIQAIAAKKAAVPAEESDTTDPSAPETATETPKEKEVDFSKQPLPELTDELVKQLGQPGQFNDVTDFRNKIKEHLTIQKEQDVEGRHRVKITDTIIAGSTIELPQILIDSEMGQMFAQMEEDLARSNLKMDDYLNHIKKTKDDLKTEWAPAAEKRAKLQLILNEIAKKDKIVADTELIKKQVEEILKQYKDADPYRVGIYVTSVMTNEAVMKTLEAEK